MIALFAMMMMMFIAVEVTFDTTVDYSTSSQAVNRLKAYYAARAGVELSLLRIKLYRKIAAQTQSGSSGAASMIPMQMLDQIWQMPFMWPFPVPDTLTSVEKDQIQKAVKQSQMQAQYATRIESEGNKIDVNDLASPSTTLAKSTHDQILKIFTTQMQNDDAFAERYRGFDFNKLVNNMTDWVDEDHDSLNGGDEASYYPDIQNNHFIPPNQAFKSLDELHMVASMTDDLYKLLEPRVTVFGIKGINVNYASPEVLMSLDPGITDEVMQKLNKYKVENGPFRGKDDFFAFLRGAGVNTRNLEADGALPLYFDAELNFRITSTATFGKSAREIVAITYDFDRVESKLVDLLKADAKNQQQQPGTQQPNPQQPAGQRPAQPATNQPAQNQVAAGRPNIVYWHED